MILADKIIELRKKNGWSQEELAEMLGVSRQAISKWEGAQSVPDMNRILKLSEVFGVSTDLLLKDEMALTEYAVPVSAENDGLRIVSMEEAAEFISIKNRTSGRVALGVMMCILSPVLLIALATAQETGRIGLSETSCVGIGLVLLFLLVGGAVALFVTSGVLAGKYAFMEEEPIETAYGVKGMAQERKEMYRPVYIRRLTIGIVLCVVAVIPLFLTMAVFGENAFAEGMSVCVMLALVAIGAFLIVIAAIRQSAYDMLLEEGGYSRAEKKSSKKTGWIGGVYWLAVVAGFLAYSFRTNNWNNSWIIWPIAALVFAILMMVVKAFQNRE